MWNNIGATASLISSSSKGDSASGVGAAIVFASSFALLRAFIEFLSVVSILRGDKDDVDVRLSGGIDPSNNATVSGSVVSNISCLL